MTLKISLEENYSQSVHFKFCFSTVLEFCSLTINYIDILMAAMKSKQRSTANVSIVPVMKECSVQ